MPKIQIKMSKKEIEDLRSLLVAFRKDRAIENEFEGFINGLIDDTFNMSMKISNLLKEN